MHRYVLLDGLRGVAAIMVLLHHIENGSGESGWLFYNGFLAVDLFFILSGFVIAYSYDKRLSGGMTFGSFAVLRLIRLWPLAALGALLGAVAEVGIANVPSVGVPLLQQMLFIPSFSGENIYPYNGIQWTLFFELFVNAVYALGAWKLSNRALGLVVLVSFVSLVAAGLYFGTIGNGWGSQNFIGGFPRVSFGFFAGVGLFRLTSRYQISVPPMTGAAILVAYVAVSLFASVALKHTWKVDILICVLVFPVIVYLAAWARVGRTEAVVLLVLGELSYPLYALQGPIRHHLMEVWSLDGTSLSTYVITTLVVGAVAYAALKIFDEPVRAFLRERRSRLARSS